MTFRRVGQLICDTPGCAERVAKSDAERLGWRVMPGRPGVDYSVKRRKDFCAIHALELVK